MFDRNITLIETEDEGRLYVDAMTDLEAVQRVNDSILTQMYEAGKLKFTQMKLSEIPVGVDLQ